MITRILVDKEGKYFYQQDGKSISTHFGMVTAEALSAAKDGEEILSNTHEKFTVISPTWLDRYRKMERGPQVMMLKDLGVIAAETGIGPDSIVGDAGTGTGAAAIYFSRVAKQVHSFDVEKDHMLLGKKNAEALGAENIIFYHHDIYGGIPDEQFDLFVWDNPEPWNALPYYQSIRIGGWIVAYLPSINQTATFVNAVQKLPQLQYRKTIELIERTWAIKEQRVRPSSDSVGHTGFLVFVRRIR